LQTLIVAERLIFRQLALTLRDKIEWARAIQYTGQIARQEIAKVIYYRRAAKNDWSTAAASAARTPEETST
jgi:hypothetical protein